MSETLLEVQQLTKLYGRGLSRQPEMKAVDNVSLVVPADRAQITAIAGESGSGKTTLAMMVLGLTLQSSGKILFKGNDTRTLSRLAFRDYRRHVQAIFQNPYEAFNPFYRIDHVFDLVIKQFGLARSREEAERITKDALEIVRLKPSETLGRYIHQLSGGQLQRVMIARAFLVKPRLIVADEAVSMVDASLRAIILDIMVNLKNEFGISQLYITHDLSTALQISDDILIMYKGAVVERGDAAKVIQSPKHPYTQLLVSAIPLPDKKWEKPLDLAVEDAGATASQQGCKFFDRCPRRMDACRTRQPALLQVAERQEAACLLYENAGRPG